MDSGVSILNFSTCRKCWACFRSMTGLHPRWGLVLGTGDCKTREILHFPPFLLRSLTEETGYRGQDLVFEGPCILTGSGVWLDLDWKEWQDLFASLIWKNGELLLVDWVRLEESLGGRVLCPRPLEWVEKTLEPRLLDFPLPGENDGYC